MQHTSNTIRRRAVSTAVHNEEFLDDLQQHRVLFEPLQIAASASDPHHVQVRDAPGLSVGRHTDAFLHCHLRCAAAVPLMLNWSAALR